MQVVEYENSRAGESHADGANGYRLREFGKTAMKIIHTSDWHLGRSFGAMSLHRDQADFCEWLTDLVESSGINLVVIAGDIYDRSIAPIDSIELFRKTIRDLRAAGAVIAVISGNHDGPDRLSPYDDLLDLSGVYIRGGYEGVGRVVTHSFEDGPLDIALLPFLDPQSAPDGYGDQAVADASERRRRRTHHSVLADGIQAVHNELKSPRSIAVAHAFVSGGSVSDSERALEVGGTGAVEASLFDRFSYTALGHLHRPQEITRPSLRYSGTPLAYSFSEEHAKSVTMVEMLPDGHCEIETIEVPVGRAVKTISGPIETLLDPASHPDAHDRFVRAIISDRETVIEPKARLEAVYPFITEIRLSPVGGVDLDIEAIPDIAEVDPIEAVRMFWVEVEGTDPDADTEILLTAAVEFAQRGEK